MPPAEQTPPASDQEMRAELQGMLEEIAYEVKGTRYRIGKEVLDPRVLAAMAKVPRDRFVPELLRFMAFRNGPVPIGHGQTLSQPFMVALMTDLLNPGPDSVVLEIGTGSGYQAAILAQLVRQVYSIEIIKPLADAARRLMAELGYTNVAIRLGNGYHGLPEFAPYDGIVVTAAAPHVPPALVEQLKPGARLVIPVGMPNDIQVLRVIDKRADGGCDTHSILAVAFVPLTQEEK